MNNPRGRVLQTADNALRVLLYLSGSAEPRALGEIARELQLAKSVAHNLMFTLRKRGFVQQDDKSRQYSLGLQLVTVGQAASQRLDLRRIAQPHMHALAADTGESVYLMVAGINMSVLLDRLDPPNPIKVTMEIGQEGHFHAGSSNKAILAFLPEPTIERIIADAGLPALRSHTPTTASQLWHQIREIRTRGYAYTEEEAFEGIAGLAAPVFDWTGKVVASIGIAGLVQRLRPRRETLVARVLATAAEVSAALGFEHKG